MNWWREVHATDDSSSGQSQSLRALLRYRDVFAQVDEGKLVMIPVLYQGYWMYEQPKADHALLRCADRHFPLRVPTAL